MTGAERRALHIDTHVVALNGDWVLITNMGNDVDGQQSELWNARTGTVVPFASYLGVAAWGVTPSGDVLRGNEFVALRTADLHAGTWSPAVIIRAGGVSKPLFWDSGTSFIAPDTDDANHDGYERCSVGGQCHDLGIPGNALIAGVYHG